MLFVFVCDEDRMYICLMKYPDTIFVVSFICLSVSLDLKFMNAYYFVQLLIPNTINNMYGICSLALGEL